MARPKKWRRVCCLPHRNRFGPLDGISNDSHVNMTVDEYETIRLIDLEGMIQQECAESMGVARTTVQAIYESARKKIADFIVNGRTLRIEGGEYMLCDEHEGGCGGRRCRGHGKGRRRVNK